MTTTHRSHDMTDKLQYYYKDNACPAEHSRAETCICWHDEGKGPFPDLKNGDAIPMAYGSAIGLTWRAAPQPDPEDDYHNDPSVDERWNAGCDYAMMALCKLLRINTDDVTWDAATEELEGDVLAVLGNILTVRFGDDWRKAAPQPAHVDREALVAAVRNARVSWANDGNGESCPDEAIADWLIEHGLRLPSGDETMAWAVLGEDGEVIPGSIYPTRDEAKRVCDYEGERVVRVAVRVVEGGDDA